MNKSLVQIHTGCPFPHKRRVLTEERMRLLGIDESDYLKYQQIFLQPRERHHYISKTPNGWIEINYPWDQKQVLRHLTGEWTIGLFPAAELDYLMIDIDRHDDQDEADLRFRIEKTKNLFEGDPLMYQSSFSGGIRLCYFLPEPVSRKGLYHASKDFFEHGKAILKPGEIEILATRKGDRIPFGSGSYLIDPFTLEPIYHLTLKETIAIAYRVFKHQKIEIPFDITNIDEKVISYSADESVFNQIVSRLYEEGLHPEMTTNDALLMLSWDLIIRKRYSKDDAERFLTNWILSKHNGLSKRFNAGKVEDVIQQIKRIVRNVNPSLTRYPVSRYAQREKKLSLSDIRKITLLTENPKLQLPIFSLLEYCLCFSKRDKNRENNKGTIGNIYVSEKGDVTYGSGFQNNLYCQIAKRTLQRLPGFDKANPQKTRQKIEALGLLSLKRPAHPDSHHCRQYWVNFDFDENDPVKVVSLDEGLLELQQLNKGFKRCTAKNQEYLKKEVN